MADNASSTQDDLSDIDQDGSPKISPYLMMQAQKEMEMGKPGPAMLQLGHMGLKSGAISAPEAAFHAEKNGFAPPGTANRILAQSTPPKKRKPAESEEEDGAIDLSGKEENMPQPMEEAAIPQKGPKEGPAPNLASLSEYGWPAESKSKLASMIDDLKGVKNPMASLENSLTKKDEQTSKQNVGAMPGTYLRGLQETQGYTFEKNPNPTGPEDLYIRSDQPDPNSPFQKQQSALDKLTALVNQRAGRSPAQMPHNLTGLMQAADFANHTNTFAPSYAKQYEEQMAGNKMNDQRSEEDFKNQAAALKEQQELYKQAQTGALGIMGGGSVGTLNNTLALEKAIEASKAAGNPNTATNQVMSTINRVFKPIQDEEEEADKVVKLVNSHNPAAISGIKEALTRVMTGARPQMQLIQQQAQDPSLGQRLESYVSLASTGQLPLENVAQMNQMVSDLNKVMGGRRAVAENQMRSFGGQMGKTSDEMNGLIPPRASPGLAGQAAAEGKKSVHIREGKASANAANAPVTMYKNGQPFQVPPGNVEKAKARGYTTEHP